jgi:H+/gluconate symporter-like permease
VLIPITLFGNKCSPQTEEEKAKKVQKNKLSGKQRARRIALIMMILVIVNEIADVIKGNSTPYVGMIDLLFGIVCSYCLVMFVGYPIVRQIARRNGKPKDEQKQ